MEQLHSGTNQWNRWTYTAFWDVCQGKTGVRDESIWSNREGWSGGSGADLSETVENVGIRVLVERIQVRAHLFGGATSVLSTHRWTWPVSGVSRSKETAPPQDSTLGLCREPYGGPREGSCFLQARYPMRLWT